MFTGHAKPDAVVMFSAGKKGKNDTVYICTSSYENDSLNTFVVSTAFVIYCFVCVSNFRTIVLYIQYFKMKNQLSSQTREVVLKRIKSNKVR